MPIDLEVETLLKIVLLLVIVWLLLEIVTEAVGFLLGPLFALLKPLIGLIVLALIVLWLLDRI